MKITKHVHSCLVVEEEGKKAVIDPGSYTAAENALDAEKLGKVDYVLVTHEHPDHMDVGLIKSILEKSNAKVISNSPVAKILAAEGIEAVTEGDGFVIMGKARHEDTLQGAPENAMFTIAGKLTHPGDSHSFTKTTEILALPVHAPWGSFVNAIKLAEKLKPKAVIPIHDWHWNDKARAWQYELAAGYLGKRGIRFLKAEKGKAMEL